jgi:hypothetical protein
MMGAMLHDRQVEVVSLTATGQAAVSVFHSVNPVTNGAISAYALRRRTARLSSSVPAIWPRARDQWCGVSQVVKNAQSRGRTERTLLTDFLLSAVPSAAQGCCRKT